jgi:hypothetical protein
VKYNVKEFITSVINISAAAEVVILNGQEFKGERAKVRIQRSLIVDLLKTEALVFRKEDIKFYG